MAFTIIRFILAVALVSGLILAGRRIYLRLPPNVSTEGAVLGSDRDVELTVIAGENVAASNNTSVEAYKIDFLAMQREYQNGPRPQKPFDEFLNRRLRGLEPARARFDSNGRAILKVSGGNWWIRVIAELGNGERLEWRVPINVMRRNQTLELTSENIYERTKKF